MRNVTVLEMTTFKLCRAWQEQVERCRQNDDWSTKYQLFAELGPRGILKYIIKKESNIRTRLENLAQLLGHK